VMGSKTDDPANAFGVLVLGAVTVLSGATAGISAIVESMTDGEVGKLKLDILQVSQEARVAVQQIENLCK
jgi:hypothetical protein